MTDTLQVTVQHLDEGLAVLSVTGDVDLHTASTLRSHALALFERGTVHLVLDLARVDFFDSTGLSTLIGLWHAAQGAGGSLVLAAVPDRLERMINMTGLSLILPVRATVADALAGRGADGSPGGADSGGGTS
ncbi:STAS domain-containing protein [Streptomyces sp. NPDC003247]|uniref:STAS domain-containing protein n=1 Tax=Streptomyces sp. NPDC003247 TaxID=3364677 RepID=UPI003696415B